MLKKKKKSITFTFELLASNTLHSQMLQPVKTNIFSTLPVFHSMLDSLSVCTVCWLARRSSARSLLLWRQRCSHISKSPQGTKMRTCPRHAQTHSPPPNPATLHTPPSGCEALGSPCGQHISGSRMIPEWRLMMAAAHCNPPCGRPLKSCNRQIVT